MTGGSQELIDRYGPLKGSQYNFKTTEFTKQKENVIQQEFLPIVENVPIENLAGSDSSYLLKKVCTDLFLKK